jgi:hypothetical protein
MLAKVLLRRLDDQVMTVDSALPVSSVICGKKHCLGEGAMFEA